jgi:hypothetical protein
MFLVVYQTGRNRLHVWFWRWLLEFLSRRHYASCFEPNLNYLKGLMKSRMSLKDSCARRDVLPGLVTKLSREHLMLARILSFQKLERLLVMCFPSNHLEHGVTLPRRQPGCCHDFRLFKGLNTDFPLVLALPFEELIMSSSILLPWILFFQADELTYPLEKIQNT